MNENIVMRREDALNLYREAQTPAALRELLAGDLFFLLWKGLGRADVNRDFLYERCREVQARPDGHLDLWAREHYKSTIITVGKTIQDILNDPDITVGIFSHTRPIARSFLKQIKREFEGNPLLQELFPHVRPPDRRERRSWSEDEGLIVQRRSNPKEATLEAWGLVDGQPTGKHFSLLVYDDVVTRESVHTPEMIKKTTEAWELSLNLGTRDGRRRMIGTRYHLYDSYREILDRGAALPRLYPATRDGSAEGVPALLRRDELDRKRRDMGPYTFGCQMLLNPVADRTQGFREEWLRYWEPMESRDAGGLCPARTWGDAGGQRPPMESRSAGGPLPPAMNRYILVDPAGEKKQGSDYTVIWVIGLGADTNYYLIDGLRDRLNLTRRARELIRLHRRYRPKAVGYEQYGMQADVEHIRYVQDQENYRFGIIELGGPMPKNDRIRRLVPLFEQGRVYIPGRLSVRDAEGALRNLTEEFVREEYLSFPVSRHDDMLDCLARILDPDMEAVFPEALPPEARFPSGPPMAVMEWRPW